MTTTSLPQLTKRIGDYDRDSRDYPAFVVFEDGREELVGYAPTHHDAELLVSAYIIQFYQDNHTPEKAAELIAQEIDADARHALLAQDMGAAWEGSSDEPISRRSAGVMTGECALCGTVQCLYDDGEAFICVDRQACLARQRNSDPFDDSPSQEEQAASAAAWTPCEGGWEQYTPHPFDPSQTIRLFQPRLFNSEPTSSAPAASPLPVEQPESRAALSAAPRAHRVNWSETPSGRLIPCAEIDLSDPASVARLAKLPAPLLAQQARVSAAYARLLGGRITDVAMLARFEAAIAAPPAATCVSCGDPVATGLCQACQEVGETLAISG